MTRNETLTLLCLALIVANDALLIYAYFNIKAKTDRLRQTVYNLSGGRLVL